MAVLVAQNIRLRASPRAALRVLRRSLSPAAPLLPAAATPGRLTLCLDLDECLVHSTVLAGKDEAGFMEPCGPEATRAAAAHAGLHRKHRARAAVAADHEIELPYLDAPLRLHKRPLLDDFLVEAAKLCEVVLFTAAAAGYARQVAERLDPSGSLFAGVLTREHCTPMNSALVKDLGQLGRPLERVVLVDDNVGSCMLHPDNAVPIRPFLGDPADRELVALLPLLRTLRDHDDVRGHLRGAYRLREKLLQGVREAKAAQAARGGG